MDEEKSEGYDSVNLALAKTVTALATVIGAQNKMLMQVTDRLAESGMLEDSERRADYFLTFRRVLDEASNLNNQIGELAKVLQNEDVEALRKKHEE